MPCLAPRPRFGGQPPNPNCRGPEGALDVQCPWCRKAGRTNHFAGMAFRPLIAPLMPPHAATPLQWTDHYRAQAKHNVDPLAAQHPAVRTLLPQLKEGAATLVAGVSVTPRILQYLSQLKDREIGLLTDTQGRGNLYLTLGAPTGVSRPQPKANYRFLAHTHPTISDPKGQITGDMTNAVDQAEIVVTMGRLILYYDEGRCYNPLSGDAYQPRDGLFNLDTVLDVGAFTDLTARLHRERDEKIIAERERLRLLAVPRGGVPSASVSSSSSSSQDDDDDWSKFEPFF